MKKTLANGMTRWEMMYQIKLQCDTNSACYKMTDEELIATYNAIFNIAQKVGLGEGLLDRLRHSPCEVDRCVSHFSARHALGHLLNRSFHRCHFGHEFLGAGVVGGARKGATDGVRLPHEVDVAHAAG